MTDVTGVAIRFHHNTCKGELNSMDKGDKTFFETLSALPADSFANETVSFRLIQNEADLAYAVIECRLTEKQKELVNPAGFSIGHAWLDPSNHFPCVICNREGRPVGFINLLSWLGGDDSVSWSFYIDERKQGKGYGRAAARLAVKVLKAAFPDKKIKLSTEACNTKAQALYLYLGFQKLEETDGDDLVFGL